METTYQSTVASGTPAAVRGFVGRADPLAPATLLGELDGSSRFWPAPHGFVRANRTKIRNYQHQAPR